MILSPLAPRLRELNLGLRGVQTSLASRPAGKALLEAAAEATDETVLAVLPLLDENVGVEIRRLPSTAANTKLVDDDLKFLRGELHVEIVAIRPPGAERWTAGGRVSETELQPHTEMLALGACGDLDAARARLAFAGVRGRNPGSVGDEHKLRRPRVRSTTSSAPRQWRRSRRSASALIRSLRSSRLMEDRKRTTLHDRHSKVFTLH